MKLNSAVATEKLTIWFPIKVMSDLQIKYCVKNNGFVFNLMFMTRGIYRKKNIKDISIYISVTINLYI